MRNPSTITVSLPPEIAEEFEQVRKAENRSRSEMIREALRTYFTFLHRFPEVRPTKSELTAIRRGRQAYARGEYAPLEHVFHDLATGGNKTRAKSPRKASSKR
ncbi:MAG: ribbon-helix-helix protein, CopG family [Acidobacteria bacterium]|nr:ribbon-helix-helix protein, CopG family [Acidobacteriota bacterium]MCZ6490199.1 ribbon-helix-helix protein, CopG family [Acidobacteriota bacterium]MCZ6751612.1 ribbon-helix-helix protein, CopG family [Acidobacteriota bacterium]